MSSMKRALEAGAYGASARTERRLQQYRFRLRASIRLAAIAAVCLAVMLSGCAGLTGNDDAPDSKPSSGDARAERMIAIMASCSAEPVSRAAYERCVVARSSRLRLRIGIAVVAAVAGLSLCDVECFFVGGVGGYLAATYVEKAFSIPSTFEVAMRLHETRINAERAQMTSVESRVTELVVVTRELTDKVDGTRENQQQTVDTIGRVEAQIASLADELEFLRGGLEQLATMPTLLRDKDAPRQVQDQAQRLQTEFISTLLSDSNTLRGDLEQCRSLLKTAVGRYIDQIADP